MPDKLYLLSSINVSEENIPMAKTFAEYYSSLGVDEFFLVLNGTNDEVEEFVEYMDSNDMEIIYTPWETPYHANVRDNYVYRMHERLIEIADETDWMLTVDADEFFVFPDKMPWDEFTRELEKEDAQYLISFFLDMTSKDLSLIDFEYGMDIVSTFPIPTLFSQNVMRAEVQKIPLSRVYVGRNRYSCHTIPQPDAKAYKYFSKVIPLRHFRLTKVNVESLASKAEIYSAGQRFNRKAKKYRDGYKFIQDPSRLETIIIDTKSPLTSVSYNHWKPRYKRGSKMKLYCENSIYGSEVISPEGYNVCDINLSSIGIGED